MSRDDSGVVEPDLAQARQTALRAHAVIVKLKEMGLPDELDSALASLSTDLGDLWSGQALLAERITAFLQSPDDWEAVGDRLVDLKTAMEHVGWHAKSARAPAGRIARFAYKQASGGADAV